MSPLGFFKCNFMQFLKIIYNIFVILWDYVNYVALLKTVTKM